MTNYAQKLTQFEFDIKRGFSPTGALAMQLDENAVHKAIKRGCSHAELLDIQYLACAPIEQKINISRFLRDEYGSCRKAIKAIYK